MAEKLYGNANDWERIFNVNKPIIGPDPERIYPGVEIVIP
ncbi:hypothetical protein H6H03_32945 [Nostoc paludosum FACHB-159]|uniref:LysM domain-containing protein n=1 Tax=Nostoc paludosum FACHB-159 TaxID=2692908 RepID=A0ABR8KIN8_9NOSO|nr:hypothetical protein [Nostoc sp. FACHB-857]MBD2738631.1 hypothetical protein [Nostoc paludosum FACHB-159]